MEKRINFIIGYGKEKESFVDSIKSSAFDVIDSLEIYKSVKTKKKFLINLLNVITEKLKEKEVIYVDDYYLKGNNHYLINNELKEINNEFKIDAILFLGSEFNKCKSSFPTVYDRFDNINVKSFSGDVLKDLLNNSYQGYAFYYKSGNKREDFTKIESYGYADYSTLGVINDKSLFRLASVTKQFIAYGIMTLVEAKRLSLETTLYSLFNDMPEYTKEITVKMLLQHTSGLPDYEDYADVTKQVTDYEILDIVREVPNGLFKPGEKYKYSNTGYVILGLIIEKISYTKLGIYMKNNVFDVVGMKDTIVNYEGETVINNRVYGQKMTATGIVRNDQSYTSAAIGDGGIYSNIHDLKKWIKYLRKNKSVLELMTSDRVKTADNLYYGYGLRIKEIEYNGQKIELYYHTGSTIGTNTLLGFVDDLDVEFVLLTNQNTEDTSVLLKKFLGANFYKNI